MLDPLIDILIRLLVRLLARLAIQTSWSVVFGLVVRIYQRMKRGEIEDIENSQK